MAIVRTAPGGAASTSRGVVQVSGVGDSTTDDSAAFSAAYSTVAGNRVTLPVLGSNSRGTKVIEIPAGTYLITTPGALMSDLGIGRTAGLTIRGAGRGVTNIIFTPGSADQYLLDNNDDWLRITFEDITFNSTVASASFMRSVSSGGAQNYTFNRVDWTGTWKYGVHLTGTNTNSEMSWFHCGITGNWTAFLYSPDTSSGGSDQFLNYNFFNCQNEVATGHFIDMASGGNINVWGGSLIHLGTGSETGSANQVFFRLRGGDHARGVQRLHVAGSRFEHKHQNSQMIVCDWKRGNVSFVSCDTDAHATFRATPASCITADFGTSSDVMPVISFENSTLMGVHVYRYGVNSWGNRKLATYRNCDIVNWATASQFISYVQNTGTGSNIGGQPVISFEQCRGNAASDELFDCNLGWHQSRFGEPKRRVVSFKTAQGNSPSTAGTATVTVKLPLNAVITRVRGFKPAADGSSASTNFAYTLTDADATVIDTIVGNGSTTWANGFSYVSAELQRRVTTDNQRTVTMTAANITQASTNAHLLIEYLA